MRLLLIPILLTALLIDCAGEPGSTGPERGTQHPALSATPGPDGPRAAVAARDCAQLLRYDGTTYNATGYTSRVAERAGTAQESRCDDVGRNARGSYFPNGATSVPAYALSTVPPSTAIAIPEPRAGTYGVYVAADIGLARAERMLVGPLGGRFDP